MKLKAKVKHTLLQVLLLTLSLSLFAFIDSEYFRTSYDFNYLLSQYETLSPTTQYRDQFGIEVEGYYSENRQTHGQDLLFNYNDLAKLNPDNDFEIKFSNDPSIHFPDGRRPVEIISPILTQANDAEKFYHYLEIVSERNHFRSEPLNSGTHLHFDFRDPSPQEIVLLTIVLEKILPDIESAFSISEIRRAKWSRSYTNTDFQSLLTFLEYNTNLYETKEKLNVDRNTAVNWKALGKHKTFEFRAFNSTHNVQLLRIQQDLIGKIVKAVRLRDQRLIQLIKKETIFGITLQKVATALDCLIAEKNVLSYVQRQTQEEIQFSKKIQPQLKTYSDRFNPGSLSEFLPKAQQRNWLSMIGNLQHPAQNRSPYFANPERPPVQQAVTPTINSIRYFQNIRNSMIPQSNTEPSLRINLDCQSFYN